MISKWFGKSLSEIRPHRISQKMGLQPSMTSFSACHRLLSSANPTAESKFKSLMEKFSIRSLLRKHGFPLVVFYCAFNQSCVLWLTAMLHFEFISINSVRKILRSIALEGLLPEDKPETRDNREQESQYGLLVLKYVFATTIMNIMAPIQIPLSVTLWPYARRLFPFFEKCRLPGGMKNFAR